MAEFSASPLDRARALARLQGSIARRLEIDASAPFSEVSVGVFGSTVDPNLLNSMPKVPLMGDIEDAIDRTRVAVSRSHRG